MEAKTFFFSMKASQLRLEERRKGFLRFVLVGLRCASWLAAMVEEASQPSVLVDFVKSSGEGRKSLIVKGKCNTAGGFLEVVACVDDNRKGIIWIPEARSGWGWRRFVAELRSLLAVLVSSPGYFSDGSVLEDTAQLHVGKQILGSSSKVLRSPSGKVVDAVRPQLLLLQELDHLPMASRVVLGFVGEEVHFEWDCFRLECGILVPLPVRVAVSDRRKKRKHLGLLCLGLGRLGLGFPS